MKTLATFVLLSLICFLCNSPAAAAPHALSFLTRECCRNSTRFPILQAKVSQVTLQKECGLKAIVVTTVCDRKICLDENWEHAQNLLQEFQKSGPSNAKCHRKV